jgi:hypothetical protein
VDLPDAGYNTRATDAGALVFSSARVVSGYPSAFGDEVLVAAPDSGTVFFLDQNYLPRAAHEQVSSNLQPLVPTGRMLGAGPGHLVSTLVTVDSTTVTLWSRPDAGVFQRSTPIPLGTIASAARFSLDAGTDDEAVAVLLNDGGLTLVLPP